MSDTEVRAFVEAILNRQVPGFILVAVRQGPGLRIKTWKGMPMGKDEYLHATLGSIGALVRLYEQGVPAIIEKTRGTP